MAVARTNFIWSSFDRFTGESPSQQESVQRQRQIPRFRAATQVEEGKGNPVRGAWETELLFAGKVSELHGGQSGSESSEGLRCLEVFMA